MGIIVSIIWRTAALLACVHAGTAQAVCHVKADATGANTGTSWLDAYTDLQLALQATTCSEIWVAQGVYKPTASTSDRNATFSIRPAVAVYGGFIGTETARHQADPGAHRTVLSGDIDNNDTVDADGITRAAADQLGANSYTVVTMDGTAGAGSIGADTVLDGFAISGGSGAPYRLPSTIAGGLFCDATVSGRSCSPLLTRLWFAGNGAEYGAGAMFMAVLGTSAPVLKGVTFSGNEGLYAASAIYNYTRDGTVTPSLSNVTFAQNSSPGRGATISSYAQGGTITQSLDGVTFMADTYSVFPAAHGYTTSGGTIASTIENSVVWHSRYTNAFEGQGSVTVRDSVVRGGCVGVSQCIGVVVDDPGLGPLADHGGATPTTLPGVGGSALDTGNPTACGTAPLTVDQRGMPRPQGPACDLGAVELRQVGLAAGVSGPGSITASASGSTPIHGGIAACGEAGTGCTAGYVTEPVAATVVLDIVSEANMHLASISDSCGPGGTSIGTLAGGAYTLAPLVTDCTVLAQFAPDLYMISGAVSGLVGSGLVLSLNGSESLPITTDGPFTFATALASGADYAVTVQGAPSQPPQPCVVSNGSGSVDNADIDDVLVTCAAVPALRLDLDIDDSHAYLRYGEIVDYQFTLRNDGNAAATNVAVAGMLSDAFDGALLLWQCVGAGDGATCTETGEGAFADTVTLPPKRSLSWLVSVPIRAEATDAEATFAVTVAGAMPTTVAATGILVILRDGFDNKGNKGDGGS